MNTRILLLAISAAALSSCSSVYKTGQTPDDVYYSPAQEKPAYVSGQSQDQNRSNHEYCTGNNYYSDYYLRMKSSNYYRWSTFDDYYWYNWRFNTYLYDPFYSPFYSPMYYGNPYANPYTYYNPKDFYTTSNYSGPRMYNLNTYDHTSGQATYFNPKLGNNLNTTRTSSYTPTTDRGGFLRSVFSTNSKSSYYNPSGSNNRYNGGTTRTFESSSGNSGRSSGTSSGSSSGGHSSSGGSAPVRRF